MTSVQALAPQFIIHMILWPWITFYHSVLHFYNQQIVDTWVSDLQPSLRMFTEVIGLINERLSLVWGWKQEAEYLPPPPPSLTRTVTCSVTHVYRWQHRTPTLHITYMKVCIKPNTMGWIINVSNIYRSTQFRILVLRVPSMKIISSTALILCKNTEDSKDHDDTFTQ